MSVDFAALVHAFVAGVADVRACLIVSRDGLALGAYPADEEERALTVWSQVTALGDLDRGFVGLRDEVWVFCRRGPYSALATGAPTARAGLVLDRMDEMLLVAEEIRLKKGSFRPAEREAPALDAPRGPRTPLHREPREEFAPRSAPAAAFALEPEPPGEETAATAAVTDQPSDRPAGEASSGAPAERADEPASVDEVDTMALRREFAGILMPSDKPDEES